jgi:hypothetical protein
MMKEQIMERSTITQYHELRSGAFLKPLMLEAQELQKMKPPRGDSVVMAHKVANLGVTVPMHDQFWAPHCYNSSAAPRATEISNFPCTLPNLEACERATFSV